MRGWFDKVTQSQIVTYADGQMVWYPHGPCFKAYAVSKPAHGPIILESVQRFNAITITACLVVFVIGGALGHGMAALIAAMIVAQLSYLKLVRRLTRRLVVLPFLLRVRIYACFQDEQRLWEQLFCSIFLLIGICFVSVVRPSMISVLLAPLLLFLWLQAVTLLVVRFRLSDRNAFQ